jgi:hypothetical protein
MDGEPRLALELDLPAPVLPVRPRSRATPLQNAKNSLGPEVLMEVDGAHGRSL